MSRPRQEVHEITIRIDASEYILAERALTGAQLRELPSPPIPSDRDLFLLVEGSGEDQLVASDEVVQLDQGTTLFSVPRTITPGSPLVLARAVG